MANSMIGGVSNNNVWYVDSGASNCMTSHGEWFTDALPSLGVNSLEGSPKCNCGKRDSEGAPGFQL